MSQQQGKHRVVEGGVEHEKNIQLWNCGRNKEKAPAGSAGNQTYLFLFCYCTTDAVSILDSLNVCVVLYIIMRLEQLIHSCLCTFVGIVLYPYCNMVQYEQAYILQ